MTLYQRDFEMLNAFLIQNAQAVGILCGTLKEKGLIGYLTEILNEPELVDEVLEQLEIRVPEHQTASVVRYNGGKVIESVIGTGDQLYFYHHYELAKIFFKAQNYRKPSTIVAYHKYLEKDFPFNTLARIFSMTASRISEGWWEYAAYGLCLTVAIISYFSSLNYLRGDPDASVTHLLRTIANMRVSEVGEFYEVYEFTRPLENEFLRPYVVGSSFSKLQIQSINHNEPLKMRKIKVLYAADFITDDTLRKRREGSYSKEPSYYEHVTIKTGTTSDGNDLKKEDTHVKGPETVVRNLELGEIATKVNNKKQVINIKVQKSHLAPKVVGTRLLQQRTMKSITRCDNPEQKGQGGSRGRKSRWLPNG
jgi:hypothetical protein